MAPGLTLADRWTAAADGSYDLSAYGPNGFLRAWRGTLSSSAHATLAVTAEEDAALCGMTLVVANSGSFPVHAVVTDAYTRQTVRQAVQPGQQQRIALALSELFGWYDLSVSVEEEASFDCQLAGHVETAATASPTRRPACPPRPPATPGLPVRGGSSRRPDRAASRTAPGARDPVLPA